MNTASEFQSLRLAGVALLVTVIIFMVGAFSAAYFRRWPLPSTLLEKLTLIANDRVGWTAQAIIFPVLFLATAVQHHHHTITRPRPTLAGNWGDLSCW